MGGTINLLSDIEVVQPFLTIAGQTAPGGGIALKGATLRIETHDVIIRGIRSRVGDESTSPEPNIRQSLSVETSCGECFTSGSDRLGVYNIIVDHSSFSWAISKDIAIWGPNHDITIQWTIISEGLYNPPANSDGAGYGLLVGPETHRISIHHNLFETAERNPLVEGGGSQGDSIYADKTATTSEVINNIVYNWYFWPGRIEGGNFLSNWIGNMYIQGPSYIGDGYGIAITNGWLTGSPDPNSRAYLLGNLGPGRLSNTEDDWLITNVGTSSPYRTNSPAYPLSGLGTQDFSAAYQVVLANAGAIIPQRDPVDTRIVSEVQNGTGSTLRGCVVGPCNLGTTRVPEAGWPVLAAGTPPVDSDQDGIPDAYEIANGLNPNDANDANKVAPSGYTYIEEYVNRLVPMPGAPAPPTAPAPGNLLQNPSFENGTNSWFLNINNGAGTLVCEPPIRANHC
jgi:hypothetical protein